MNTTQKYNNMRARYKVSYCTDIGVSVKENQDNYFLDNKHERKKYSECGEFEINDSLRHIIAVFDGLGGEALGAEVSQIASQELSRWYLRLCRCRNDILGEMANQYAVSANNQIVKHLKNKQCKTGGTTIAMISIENDVIRGFNLGDSRIYSYTENKGLIQHSYDHTIAGRYIRAGVYSSDANLYGKDNELTLFLGIDIYNDGLLLEESSLIDFSRGTIIICSDGVYKHCNPNEMINILSSENIHDKSKKIIDIAKNNGSDDNLSCIIIEHF